MQMCGGLFEAVIGCCSDTQQGFTHFERNADPKYLHFYRIVSDFPVYHVVNL
jgi:hypothetical protein